MECRASRLLAVLVAALILAGPVPAGAEAARDSRSVEIAQRLLLELGFDPGPVDNVENARTTDAVLAFERATGNVPRGEVTDELLRLLRGEAWRRGITRRSKDGRRSFKAAHIRETQSLLAQLGFDPGPIDGLYGAQTMVATMAFQQSHNLPQGLSGEQLLTALRQASVPTPVPDGKSNVVFYNWFDYIHDSFQADIWKAKNIKVDYQTFDSVDALNDKLLKGAVEYDVVVPTASFMVRQVKNGLFLPLDPDRLPNLKNLAPEIIRKIPKDVMDRDEATGRYRKLYGVPYMLGTTGFGINLRHLQQRAPQAPLTSTALLFDPKFVGALKDCGVQIIDDPDDVISMALIHLAGQTGRDVRELLDNPSVDDITAAGRILQGIRPFLRAIQSSTIKDNLSNGTICLALGYSGDIMQAKEKARDPIVYRTPRQGTLMWVDVLSIPANARNSEQALAVLDYLLDPRVIAKASNYIRYENANRESKRYMEPALREEIRQNLQFDTAYTVPERKPLVDEAIRSVWSSFKEGR